MSPKDIAIGIMSNLVRALIMAVAGWLAATHPEISNVVSASIQPWMVQVAAAFIAAVMVALAGMGLRVIRHNKIVEEAFQAGVEAASTTRTPTVAEIKGGSK